MSNPAAPLPVAVLISGRGSNMLAIARACAAGHLRARVVSVIADRSDAAGIEAAASLGLPTRLLEARALSRAEFEAQLARTLESSGAQLVALAGFMRILSAAFVAAWAGRMLNIHPSLLPAYRGLDTHRRVLAAAEREHGASVHYVTEELDGGPLICQGRLSIAHAETKSSLAARVHRLEHRIYPMVIGLIATGRLILAAGTVLLDGRPLAAPLQVSEDGAAEHTDA
ncbi:MAG TPA: phosphoribosylglycinamide formyltransferase [Steroidobacteraceae bacterium]|jgi:phosphoribosylglycinamide formyltransferase-1|nr:phosphoribosylglycinamide formyltransferase [Steroidobacteraceae bacterium]